MRKEKRGLGVDRNGVQKMIANVIILQICQGSLA